MQVLSDSKKLSTVIFLFINLNLGVQRILVISLVVMFMVHLMACIFFLVSKFEDEDTDNWAIYAGINDEIDSY